MIVPFVITMITAIFISSYMLFDPAAWLYELMELTPMSGNFKVFLLFLAVAGFVVGYISEKWTFPRLAKIIEKWKKTLLKREKKRKEYKLILEDSARNS
jgi:cation-transporting P-type ATPase 13A2